MKYKAESYARALVEAWHDSPTSEHDRVIERFIQVIRKNGDWNQIPAINTSLERLLTKEKGGKIVDIETARPLPTKIMQGLINNFRSPDIVNVKNNTKLIAGVRITLNGTEELDLSFAHKLRKLFRNA
ncbi:F0F1 ATP synthase subunit delta [Candidatus Jorgensenbacteria bacterium]|nr:F0F1 ATP synthase subunit delta [Candidatus Jorgensenbacteria bacterium]